MSHRVSDAGQYDQKFLPAFYPCHRHGLLHRVLQHQAFFLWLDAAIHQLAQLDHKHPEGFHYQHL